MLFHGDDLKQIMTTKSQVRESIWDRARHFVSKLGLSPNHIEDIRLVGGNTCRGARQSLPENALVSYRATTKYFSLLHLLAGVADRPRLMLRG